MPRKLTLTIELDGPDFDDRGIEAIEDIFASLQERLPIDLADTCGPLVLHDGRGEWCGECRIDGTN